MKNQGAHWSRVSTVYGDFPAKNTVYTPYIYIYIYMVLANPTSMCLCTHVADLKKEGEIVHKAVDYYGGRMK